MQRMQEEFLQATAMYYNLILAIFGLYIVVYILTQDSLNKIADYDMNMNGGGFGGYNGPMNGGYNGPTNNGNGPM